MIPLMMAVARSIALAADDIVVFGFDGNNGLPSSVHMVLVAQSEASDVPLRNTLLAFLRGRSMAGCTTTLLFPTGG